MVLTGEQVPRNPQTQTTTETVLREAMQALVRVQAHMLARIVVEIRAADIAVELEPWYTIVYCDVVYADAHAFPRCT